MMINVLESNTDHVTEYDLKHRLFLQLNKFD